MPIIRNNVNTELPKFRSGAKASSRKMSENLFKFLSGPLAFVNYAMKIVLLPFSVSLIKKVDETNPLGPATLSLASFSS